MQRSTWIKLTGLISVLFAVGIVWGANNLPNVVTGQITSPVGLDSNASSNDLNISVGTPNGTGNGGNLTIRTPSLFTDGYSSVAGNIQIIGGDTQKGAPGEIDILAGSVADETGNDPGNIFIAPGSGLPNNGILYFQNSNEGTIGNVWLEETVDGGGHWGSISASSIGTGLLGLTYGGTHANLSATGGSHQVLQQSSSGANITVGQLACGDLSNAAASCATDATNASNISSGTLGVGQGGTGHGTLTNHGLLVGAGSSAITQLGAGATGTLLAGQGGSADPSFVTGPVLGPGGSLGLGGVSTGTVTILPQSNAGTYNFNLPTGAGSTGQPLLSGGGGSGPMTFGTLGLQYGGTNANLSATGAAHNVLQQSSSGAAITVGQLACGDLSNSVASCSTDTTNASNISSGTLGAGRLPNPGASTLGGIESYASVSHQWINAISTSGVPSSTQPAFSDISGINTVAGGGTGLGTLTAHGVLIGETTSNVAVSTAGSVGQVLTSNGASSDPTFQAVPGGGAKNYLGVINGTNNDGNFEDGTVGSWVLGHSALTSNFPSSGSPTFGSGASGNLTGSNTSSSPLAGTYSYSYASSAATTAGDFLASPAFTIDTEDQAKVMQIKFYYKATSNASNDNWSGTSSNSFGIAIWDVTAGSWIMPAGVWNVIQSSGIGYATATFQTTSTDTQYRLVVFNANATSGATTLYFDDFFLGPQTAPTGPAMSDWVAYVPTIVGLGTTSNMTFTSRRVGDSLEVQGQFQMGTPTATAVQIPVGYNGASANVTVDTSKITGKGVIGSATLNFNAAAYMGTYPIAPAANSTFVNLGFQSSTVNAFAAAIGTNWAANQILTVNFKVPIVGWSSNTAMSSDTDTRNVSAYGVSQTPSTPSTGNAINFTATKDTHGAYSAGVYTVPVTGWYQASATVEFTVTQSAVDQVVWTQIKWNSTNIGASVWTAFGTSAAITGTNTPSATFFANAGDTVKFLFNWNTTNTPALTSNVVGSSFSINRIPGPAVVAATESVNMRAVKSGNQTGVNTNGTSVKIQTNSIVFDSHSAYDPTTNYRYTFPVSGKYNVCGMVHVGSTNVLASTYYIEFFKNGSDYANFNNDTAILSTAFTRQGCALMSANAGDFVELDLFGTGNNSSNTLTIDDSALNVYRVGN